MASLRGFKKSLKAEKKVVDMFGDLRQIASPPERVKVAQSNWNFS